MEVPMDGIEGVSQGVDMETVLKLAASSPAKDDKSQAKPQPADDLQAGGAQAGQAPQEAAGPEAALTGRGGALDNTV
jgi:hypothetical protein